MSMQSLGILLFFTVGSPLGGLAVALGLLWLLPAFTRKQAILVWAAWSVPVVGHVTGPAVLVRSLRNYGFEFSWARAIGLVATWWGAGIVALVIAVWIFVSTGQHSDAFLFALAGALHGAAGSWATSRFLLHARLARPQ